MFIYHVMSLSNAYCRFFVTWHIVLSVSSLRVPRHRTVCGVRSANHWLTFWFSPLPVLCLPGFSPLYVSGSFKVLFGPWSSQVLFGAWVVPSFAQPMGRPKFWQSVVLGTDFHVYTLIFYQMFIIVYLRSCFSLFYHVFLIFQSVYHISAWRCLSCLCKCLSWRKI